MVNLITWEKQEFSRKLDLFCFKLNKNNMRLRKNFIYITNLKEVTEAITRFTFGPS